MNGKMKLGTLVTPDLSSDVQRGVVTIVRGDSGVEDDLVWVQKNTSDALVLQTIPDSSDMDGKVDVAGDTMTGSLNIHRSSTTAFTVRDAAGTTSTFRVDTSLNEVEFPNGAKGVWFSDGSSSLAGNVTVNIDGATGIIQLLKGATISTGTGSPEGVVTATRGSIFLRSDGGAGTSLYIKESGSGNTGWVAVAAAAGGTIIVQNNDVTIDAAATTVDFSSEFAVTSSPAGEANVSLGTGISAAKIGGGGVSSTEFDYLANVTSDIQTQFSGKQPIDSTLTSLAAYNSNGLVTQTAADTFTGRTITGTASEITVTNGSGVSGNPTISLPTGIDPAKLADGTVSATEFQYINSLTSNAQTQLNAKMDEWTYVVTYGPFYINDLPGTATTQAKLGFFNTATALSQSTRVFRAGRTGTIIGMTLVSDAARTAGTATASVILAGVDTAFASGTCQLDGTLTTSDNIFVHPSSGIAITSGGDTLGVNVTTSGWTPTTANICVWLHVMYDAI